MKQTIAAITVIFFGVTPVTAEDTDVGKGLDLLGQGTELLLRGLMGEIEPALKELEGALRDMSGYHPPEVLPNGDIIIRRRVPLEPKSEIEL